MLQNAAPLRNSAPGPPNISDERVSCTAPATRDASLRLPSFLKLPQYPHVCSLLTRRTRTHTQPLAPATRNDISMSTSGPNPPVFYIVDLDMCFAPQRHACFPHLSCQKCSGHWRVFTILTSKCKCASRRNVAQFFITHPARWLGTRRFSKPTSRPSGATRHWKNTVFRDFSTFSRTCIFFLLTLSLL